MLYNPPVIQAQWLSSVRKGSCVICSALNGSAPPPGVRRLNGLTRIACQGQVLDCNSFSWFKRLLGVAQDALLRLAEEALVVRAWRRALPRRDVVHLQAAFVRSEVVQSQVLQQNWQCTFRLAITRFAGSCIQPFKV